MDNQLTLTLKKHWGYDSFRPLQEDIINSVLDGHDTLGLMPTGGGKSITFQVPGMILEGLTIVITPLISLMKDQVDNLRQKQIKAVYFHAGMTHKETTLAWEKLVNAKCKFLYVSPERLSSEKFCMELKSLPIKLVVIDEAHCISQWGYDFRPSYLNISKLRKIHPDAPFLALTATATPEVVKDICDKLQFRQGHKIFKKSFSRPNIQYIVRPTDSKIQQIVHILSRVQGTAIVYVRSRKRTKEIAEQLIAQGISAANYHAGLSFEDKQVRQDAWKNGSLRVIVATNAFGMGIDKPDVRVVIHHDLPPSLEEYYQEAGRAGRDGLKSYAVILPSANDKAQLRRKVTEAFPPRKTILSIYDFLCDYLNVFDGEGYNKLCEFNAFKFCETFSLHEKTMTASLKLLTAARYIEYIEETETRSRVMITAQKEELYDIKAANSFTDIVLKTVLRLYPGLFADYVFINETEISRKSMRTEEEVYTALLELTRLGILHYIPRKRTPYIYFPTARENSKYLQIPKSVYEDRKEIMSKRTEAIIDYTYSSETCRVEKMLRYFGETDARPCGTCDVCLSHKKTSLSLRQQTLRREELLEKLLQLLQQSNYGLTLNKICMHFISQQDEVSDLLAYLCDEGFVKFDNGLYHYKR
ncbi:MAG: RecQ family ATP-dependent DNA helicase [Muribaculaceae bacterium]|nr:RecQ family ATP-dependent DNA helicase [Muribaculaceae bacterium]